MFGSDRVLDIGKRFGLPDDQAIQNRMISKSIESAQRRIEGHHFDARRFSLQYDTVLNGHRSEVYARRREVLLADDSSIPASYFSDSDQAFLRDLHGDLFFDAIGKLVLRSIDTAWMEHLELMDYAKSSAGLRSYGQREPLMEYRRESIQLFEGFWRQVHSLCAELTNTERKKQSAV